MMVKQPKDMTKEELEVYMLSLLEEMNKIVDDAEQRFIENLSPEDRMVRMEWCLDKMERLTDDLLKPD